jgi:hypothetical protein
MTAMQHNSAIITNHLMARGAVQFEFVVRVDLTLMKMQYLLAATRIGALSYVNQSFDLMVLGDLLSFVSVLAKIAEIKTTVQAEMGGWGLC